VPDLRAGSERERLRQHRDAPAQFRVHLRIGHVHGGAEPQPAFAQHDLGRTESVDDHPSWPHHVELHEVDQRRAAGQKGGGMIGPEGSESRLWRAGAFVREGSHA
jgi:hypothetical protein